MVRLGVTGAQGRMGQAIIRLACESKEHDVVAVFEVDTSGKSVQDIYPSLSNECQLATKLSEINNANSSIDVLIDFSVPQATLNYVEEAIASRTPMVIGTTGFADEQIHKVKQAANSIPILLAYNMSQGMNVVMHMAGKISAALGKGFNADVVEWHHRHKKDIPSGSAVSIGQEVAKGRGQVLNGYPTTSEGPRSSEDGVRFASLRTGGVVGVHQVVFASDHEVIEIKHTAMNRDVFAKGAIDVGKWLYQQPKGFYTMFDYLGLSD